jgi:alpha-glucosidase (family GH31 glycosyl hydrolase)
VLDERHFGAVLAAVQLHQRLVPEIIELAQHAAETGEPILRPLAYHATGCEQIHDQFLLGERILCAPVMEPGAVKRHVIIPPGRWQDVAGGTIDGPAEIIIDVELETVPWWRRIDEQP